MDMLTTVMKSTALIRCALLAVLAPFGCAAADARLVLATREGAACPVVVPEKPSELVAYAAEEYCSYVEKMTGARPVVKVEDARRTGPVVELRPVSDPKLGTDGFQLKVEDGRLIVRGSSVRGILYGVYELLETYGGCGFWSSWCETVPRLDRFSVPADLSRTEVPAFDLRDPFDYDANGHPAFAAKIRKNTTFGTHGVSDVKCGGNAYPFSRELACHTFAKLVPLDTYWKDHPEYFSEVNGRRVREQTQLCLTNPEVLAIAASNLLACVAREPNAWCYAASHNDWFNYCTCPKCQAVIDEEGSPAGLELRFCNALAEILERAYPGRQIKFSAYQYTRRPPKVTKPRHNVLIDLCPIECDFSRPLPESRYAQNIDFCKNVEDWSRLTSNIYLFDYIADFAHYHCPFPNVRALQGNLQYYYRHGITKNTAEGAYNTPHADFAELKTWLIAKWMWNPNLDAEALIDRFITGYYGAAAAPFVRRYFDALHALPRDERKDPLIFCSQPHDLGLTDDFLVHALEQWDEAEKATHGDLVRLENVRWGKSSAVTAYLQFKAGGIAVTREPYPSPELRTRAAWMLRQIDGVKDFRFSEMCVQDEMLLTRWRKIADPAYGVPARSKAVAEAEEVFSIAPNFGSSLEKDAAASGGKAIRLPNVDSGEWIVAMAMNNLAFDPGAHYRYRVRIRADRKSGDASKNLFLSSVSGTGCSRSCTAIEPVSEYHWYEIGEWTPKIGQTLFVAPGRYDRKKFAANPAGEVLWIDQIEIERMKDNTNCARAADFVLAERGGGACPIVVPKQPSESVAYAAEEYCRYVEKMTGARPAIVKSLPDKGRCVVLAAVADKQLGEDGFRLDVRDGRLVVRGSSVRGILYGVYELLETYGGCGFWSSWCETVPRLDRFSVPTDLSRTEVPAFIARDPYDYDPSQHPEFAAKIRKNSAFDNANLQTAKYGGTVWRGGDGLHDHTFAKLLPVEEYFDKHPEYYSEIGGVRVRDQTQLCLSNPEIVPLVAERLLKYMRADPTAAWYSVTHNDWKNNCQCAKCRAIDAEEGALMGAELRFVNALAEIVEKEFPDKYLRTSAYWLTQPAPKKTKPRRNVAIDLCSYHIEYNKSIPKSRFEENVKFCRDLDDWSRIAERLSVFDYVTDFYNYHMPYRTLNVLQENIRYMRDRHVKYLITLGAYNTRHGDLAELKTWLIAKWMWNPDLDRRTLEDRFLAGYYGKAAPFVRRYLDELHGRQVDETKNPLRIWDWPEELGITDEETERWIGYWKEAEAAVGDDAMRLYNVRMSETSLITLYLLKNAATVSIRSTDYPSPVLRERAGWLLNRMDEAKPFIFDEKTVRDGMFTNCWRRLADPSFKLSATNRIVAEAEDLFFIAPDFGCSVQDDPKASGGKAIRLPNVDSGNWIVCMQLASVAFDPGSRLRYRLRVRAERSEGSVPGEFFQSYVSGQGRNVTLAGTRDGCDYVWYDIVGWKPQRAQELYVAPGAFDHTKHAISPVAQAIWIDQIEIVRED